MSRIEEQYKTLNRMRDPVIQGEMNFIDLVKYMRLNRVCFEPGCTTCYCIGYRTFLDELDEEHMAAMIRAVKRENILAEPDLDWHDALEVLLVDHSPKPFENAFLYKAYNFVWDKYKWFRYTMRQKPWAARAAVKDELQSFMG